MNVARDTIMTEPQDTCWGNSLDADLLQLSQVVLSTDHNCHCHLRSTCFKHLPLELQIFRAIRREAAAKGVGTCIQGMATEPWELL